MQNSQRQTDHLQILASRRGGDVTRLRSYIIDDASLEPGNQEMCAFVYDGLPDTRESIEDDGARTALNVVY